MVELWKLYLSGLSRLKKEVKAKGEDCRRLDILQMRLKENIEKSIYGDTKENKAERTEILGELNDISRDLCDMSFDDYCHSHSPAIPDAVTNYEKITPTEELHVPENVEESEASGELLDEVQQTSDFLIAVSGYIVTLQKNIQKAKEVFTGDLADISQEQCEDLISSFYLCDCSNFPVYNPPLYKTKVRLQHLNEQVSKLIEMCEICDGVAQPKSITKKLQDLIDILELLAYDALSIYALIKKIDVKMIA